jgi:hypothetical protein
VKSFDLTPDTLEDVLSIWEFIAEAALTLRTASLEC